MSCVNCGGESWGYDWCSDGCATAYYETQRRAAGLTCDHRPDGLCPACQLDYLEDPAAWLEFGAHPAGRANLARLEAELAAGLGNDPNDPPMTHQGPRNDE